MGRAVSAGALKWLAQTPTTVTEFPASSNRPRARDRNAP